MTHSIVVGDVNSAFKYFSKLFKHPEKGLGHQGTEYFESRYGPCYRVINPVAIQYLKPTNRVLTHPVRLVNPFFHLFEALWMLAGRNDVNTVAYFAEKMREFSDDGLTFNGAYGRRWRNGLNYPTQTAKRVDQIQEIIKHLRKNPNSRRAVLQMWNPWNDLLQIDKSKDVCCNLCVMFKMRAMECTGSQTQTYSLDMTVVNRSNDLVWGMLGTNYVHFTILHEYIAHGIGAEVGVYDHFTNDLHVYTATCKPEYGDEDDTQYPEDNPIRLVVNQERFDKELNILMQMADAKQFTQNPIHEPFLVMAITMFQAFNLYKNGDVAAALKHIKNINYAGTKDWYHSCKLWLETRKQTKGVK